MQDSILRERERALENVFFARQDEMLLQRMREADRTRSRKAAIAAATGITEDAVLDRLVALGLDTTTLSALAMTPLVLAAWADGAPSAKERDALRMAAREAGVADGTEAAALLEGWLAKPPAQDVAEAWRAYVQALTRRMDEAARAALRRDTLDRTRRVIESRGGLLGLGRQLSAAEERALTEMARAFDG
jgi:uncharacterized tellurite resistance protein B-like protein